MWLTVGLQLLQEELLKQREEDLPHTNPESTAQGAGPMRAQRLPRASGTTTPVYSALETELRLLCMLGTLSAQEPPEPFECFWNLPSIS